MWIVIIVIIIAFIIGKFLLAKNKQASKIAMEGGMRNKYSEIIHMILSGDSRSKIFEETSDSITIGTSSAGGLTLITLTQTFGNVTVQWRLDSPVFGKHKIEWDFPEYLDQNIMMEKITNDLDKYNKNIMKGHEFY